MFLLLVLVIGVVIGVVCDEKIRSLVSKVKSALSGSDSSTPPSAPSV